MDQARPRPRRPQPESGRQSDRPLGLPTTERFCHAGRLGDARDAASAGRTACRGPAGSGLHHRSHRAVQRPLSGPLRTASASRRDSDEQALGLPQYGEVFFRAYGSTFNYTSTRSFTDFGFDSSQNYAAFQVGGSWIALDDNRGTLRAGLAGSFGQLSFNPIATRWAEQHITQHRKPVWHRHLSSALRLVCRRHRLGRRVQRDREHRDTRSSGNLGRHQRRRVDRGRLSDTARLAAFAGASRSSR